MKKKMSKMRLSRETLHELETAQLPAAQGAAFPISQHDTCRCPTVSCKPGFC
ncbi:MAG TPA: hypothetical protein VHQ90_24720 [Thermoanaerobaculia bacterium]|nr:hypothetical protein [Thermoanaerobaculia bacterium]